MIQAVLMAGGKGTRLRPFTNILPKPLVPIGETSIIELVLRQLRHFGFDRILISVGHKAELIMAVIGDGGRLGVNVTYHYEAEPLGTIGSLRTMENLDDNFLVMNGDICTNLNFRELLRDHVASGATATVGTYARLEKIELGVLQIEGSERRIVGFEEKPTFRFLVSMGVNAFHRSVRELIPESRLFGFDDLMRVMIEKGVDVRSRLFAGEWHDIGRLDDYEEVIRLFEQNPGLYLPGGPPLA